MELYGKKSKSIPQKITIVGIELLLLYVSYWILFQGGGSILLEKIGVETTAGNYTGKVIIFTFSLIVFVRMTFMMFYLLKRKIPWEESISVPMAFALYYIGFSLLGYNRTTPIDAWDYVAIAVFLFGSFLNTCSELQRHFWKKQPENQGKLYTKGLFSYSMHINYFGDLLWVSAYAIVTRNLHAAAIPLFLLCFFAFYNIPKLDAYLAERYKGQFEAYRQKTKKFIPFIY
jgi:protein-S-isoprenylcysteine O-methyltransferase Ste14